MIGAGVFTTSGFSIDMLQTRERVLAAWAVVGAIAVLGAICYGALARHITESGGEYLFLSRTVHPAAGFLAGWVSLLAGFTGAIAFAATVLEAYLVPAASRPAWLPPNAIAVSAVAISATLHAMNVKSGARTQNAIVALKLLLLIGFIAFAFQKRASSGWPGLDASPRADGADDFSFPMFASALVWITLSYSGYNAAVYVAGEVQSARRNVPLAMVLATIVVVLLYLLLNTIFLYAPPLDRLLVKPPVADIAALSAESVGGRPLGIFVRTIVVLALVTSVLANVQAGPRVYAKMAADGLFPPFFSFEHGPPRSAIFLQALLAIVVICVSDLRGMLDYLGFTLSLSTAATAATLFVLQRKVSVAESSARRWFLVVPGVYCLAIVGLAMVAAYHDPRQLTGTVVTVASGLVAYWFFRRSVSPKRT
jgi:APA family basic amino acid/polyamine antiporter